MSSERHPIPVHEVHRVVGFEDQVHLLTVPDRDSSEWKVLMWGPVYRARACPDPETAGPMARDPFTETFPEHVCNPGCIRFIADWTGASRSGASGPRGVDA